MRQEAGLVMTYSLFAIAVALSVVSPLTRETQRGGAQSSYAITKLIHDFLCGFFAGADTVGNADAAIGAAGERQCGEFCKMRLDSPDARLMSDMILRHGIRMAPNAREKGWRRHPEQAGQFFADVFLHYRIVILK